MDSESMNFHVEGKSTDIIGVGHDYTNLFPFKSLCYPTALYLYKARFSTKLTCLKISSLFRFLFAGEKANVIITVSGNEKINKKTLKLDLLRKVGALTVQALVSPRGTSGAHFTSSFDSTSVPFTLKLKGKTKKGYNFERLSHNVVQPSPFIIRDSTPETSIRSPLVGVPR